MNVLHFTSTFPRWEGDFVGSFVYNLCIELQKIGVNIKVLTPRGSQSKNNFNELSVYQYPYYVTKNLETIPGQHLLHLSPLNYLQLPSYVFYGWRHLLKRQKGTDLIHAHCSIPMGFISTITKQKPVVLTCHGSDCRTKNALFRKLNIYALKRVNKTTAVSNHVRNLALNLGAPKDNLETVYFGVNVNRFNRSKFNQKEMQKKYGIPEDKIVITTIGRLVKQKRIDDFISTITLLNERYDCHFIVGGDGPERSNLENLGRSYKNLSFLGVLSKPEEVLSFTDIFVLSSVEEGLSTSLQEAMAMECTPVATNAVGCPEIIDPNQNGFLFEPYNVNDLTRKIELAIQSKFGKNARKTIVERFNQQKAAKRFLEIYKEVLL